MIDTQAIKNRILNLAMRGQMSEQMPEDGTAEGLYNQIVEEKTKLIKEGRIKKEKSLGEISDEEIPFEIPSRWKWVRLCDVSYHIWAGGDKPSDFSKEYDDDRTVPVVANGVTNEGILGYTSKATANKNTISVAGRGTIGFTILRRYDYCPIVRLIVIEQSRFINPKYLQFFLQMMPEASVGSSIPQLTVPMIKPKLVPLPPVSEQTRIVEKIEAVFEVLEKIDALQNQYASNQEALKSKFIDAAIQGKLTEQLSEDGTAEELYKQIQSETQVLIKEGRFKKKKALPDLSDVDYPFQIPKTWKWIHLGDLISIESGKGLTAAEMIPGDVPVYGGNGIIGYHDNGFVPEGTIVIGRVGYYCGSVHVTQKESWVTDNAFITTYPENCVDKWFLVYVLRKMRLGQNNNGSAQPVVSGKKIYPLAFPLPPLAEQNRIADLFKTIIPMCESTK